MTRTLPSMINKAVRRAEKAPTSRHAPANANAKMIAISSQDIVLVPSKSHMMMTSRAEASLHAFRNNYRICRELGSGGYGFVVEAEHLYTERRVAIKFIHRNKISKSFLVPDKKKQGASLPLEIDILRSLSHHSMVQYIEHFETDTHYCLVMELHGENWARSSFASPSCDLFECIESQKGLQMWQARRVLLETLSCLIHLKENNVYHRDIKDENIVVDAQYHVKLVDFGSAIRDQAFCTNFTGTRAFAAPEILSGTSRRCPEKADVWSLGVVLYIMLVGSHLPAAVFSGIPVAFYLPPTMSATCIGLLQCMLQVNPNFRYTFEEIQNHPWCHTSEPF